MFVPQERDQLRRTFIDAWQKRDSPKSLSDLERIIVEACNLHPEYHALLSDPDQALSEEYTPERGETNPFLHLGMHIAIREQLSTDRPSGVRGIYQRLVERIGDQHDADHLVMECLGRVLWEAQSQQRPPDDREYLECLKRCL